MNRKILEESPLPGDLSLWRPPCSPALLELGEGAERGRCPAAWLCSQMWAEWRGRRVWQPSVGVGGVPARGREAQALTQDHGCGLNCCFPSLLPKPTHHISISSEDLCSSWRWAAETEYPATPSPAHTLIGSKQEGDTQQWLSHQVQQMFPEPGQEPAKKRGGR